MVQLTKKRGSCIEVFKDTDHIVMAATGIHPGIFHQGQPSHPGFICVSGLFYREGIVVLWKVDVHLLYNIALGVKD